MYSRMKRLVALILVIVLTGSLLSACGKDKSKTSEKLDQTPEYITRGEWITQLAESFGMTQYENQEPYYKDVTSDNPLFGYVQSSYEWEVLSTDTDEFKPDEYATLGFVVTTSVLAAELDYEQYATSDDVNEAIIKCANEAGITNVEYSDTDALTEPVDALGAAAILASSVSSYVEVEDNDYVDIQYTENVVDGSKESIKTLTELGKNDKVVATEADKVEVGSILLMPGNEENPFGYCLKVSSKTLNSDGTYTIETVEPEIHEIFESIDVDKAIETTPDMFTPEEGVTVIPNKEANTVEKLGYVTSVDSEETNMDGTESEIVQLKDHDYEASASKGLSLSIEYSSKEGLGEVEIKKSKEVETFLGQVLKISQEPPKTEALDRFENALSEIDSSYLDTFSKENDYSFIQDYVNGKIKEDDFKKKLNETSKKVNNKKTSKDGKNKAKAEGEWKVTGTLTLETKVSVDATIKFVFFDTIPSKLKAFEVTVESKTKNEIELEGTFKATTKKLGKYTIPIAYGFGLELGAYITFDAEGKITYTYEVGTVLKAGYKDKKIKTSYKKEDNESIKAEVKAEVGVKFTGTLTFWGLGLAELGVKVSAMIKAEAEVSRSFSYGLETEGANAYYVIEDKLDFKTKGIFAAPLLTLSLGGDDTLLGLLGVEIEYQPLSEKNAPFKKTLWEYDSDKKEESLVLFRIEVPLIEEETTTEEPTTEETTTEEITSEETTTEEITTEEITTEEESKGGTLQLSDFAVIMNVGETKTLGVTIPDGYSSSDLVWSVSEGTSVKVVNGTITATSEGTSTITVKTADGKYTGQCVVVVN